MTLVARPNYLANRAVAFDDFIGGLGIAQPPRVSLKDDRFTLLDETGMTLAEPTLSLDVIIVGANRNTSRQLYDPKKPYDPNNSEGPICWSDNGIGPSVSCQQPQASTCGSCEYAQWKWPSKMTGKPVPLCSSRKKLAVLVGGHDGMFSLVIPPDSLKVWGAYLGELKRIPAAPEEIVTRIKLVDKQLIFEVADWVPEDFLLGYIDGLIKNDDMGSIVNRHDEARDPSEFKALGAPTPTPGQATAHLAPHEQQAPAPAAQLQPPAPRPRGRPPKLAPPTAPAAPQPAFQAPPAPPSSAAQIIPPQPASLQPPAGFGFGMQTAPQAPDPGVQGMLDRAFSLPRRA